MIAAATLALIVGLMLGLAWEKCLILIVGAAALTGGIVFTFLEIRRIALPPGPKQAARSTLHSAVTNLRRIIAPIPKSNDPCPHHEYYPESPGQDQGQLTSHLSGPTPVLEELAKAFRKRHHRTVTKRTR
jgi:hypothetical protein